MKKVSKNSQFEYLKVVICACACKFSFFIRSIACISPFTYINNPRLESHFFTCFEKKMHQNDHYYGDKTKLHNFSPYESELTDEQYDTNKVAGSPPASANHCLSKRVRQQFGFL